MIRTLFFLIIFTALQANAQDFSLLGNWKGNDKGVPMFMIFETDSTCIMITKTDTFGGKKFVMGDISVTTYFKADTSSSPKHLDVVAKSISDGVIISTMKGIYEIMGPNRIRVRFDPETGERPKGFMPRGNPNTFVFTRY